MEEDYINGQYVTWNFILEDYVDRYSSLNCSIHNRFNLNSDDWLWQSIRKILDWLIK